MDLSHPERTLVGRLELPLLVALARADREWTSPRLAAAVDATPAGVRQALARLVASGLVTATPVGQAQGYRFNASHVMADAIVAMGSASARLRRRIIDAIEGWALRPTSAVVFGSWARGDAGPDSDVDLLFVHAHADHEAWAEQLDALRASIDVWSGNGCDLLSFSEVEWQDIQRRGDPIVGSLSPDDTALLYGRPLMRAPFVRHAHVGTSR